MRRLFLGLLLITLLFSFASCHRASSPAAGEGEGGLTYLVAGLDDASGNTDVLLLLSLRGDRLSVIQIPRDTYCETGLSQNKINQIYSASIAAGMSKEAAMERLFSTVSSVFSVPLDGYVAVSTNALSKIVDRIGGVTLTLPEPLTLTDGERTLDLAAGEHTLLGEDSVLFIRHRRGYLLGDLARMDAQKLFLHGLFRSVKENLSAEDVFALLPLLDKEIITDASLIELGKTAVKYIPKIKNCTVIYLTIPGEAVQNERGLWYYVINRPATTSALADHLGIDPSAFDAARRLTRVDFIAFENIYEDNHIRYREYGEEELSDIRIPRG